MAFHDDNHVITCDAVVIWDGITRPDTEADGSVSHNIGVMLLANSVEAAELGQLATNVLNASEFKGKLPPGGNWPLSEPDAEKLGPASNGMIKLSAKTRLGAPQILNAHGQELQPMAYSRSLYPGAIVRILVHAYPYNNKNKGIAYGLDGIQIINDKAPALPVGGGMSAESVKNAFAGKPATAGAALPPPPGGAVKTMAPGCVYTYDQLKQSGYSDEQMITAGYLLAAPVAPTPPPVAPAPPPVAAPPVPPIVPAHDLLPPPPAGPVMVAGCPYTYDQLKASNYTDEQMRSAGYLV